MNDVKAGPERIAQPVLQRNLGSRIVELRRSRGWSQGDLAARLGIGRSRLGKWERGLNAPSLAELAGLADVFGTTLDGLALGREAAAAELPAAQREQLAKLLAGLARLLGPLMGRTVEKKRRNGLPSGAKVAPVSTTQGGHP